MSDKQIVIVLLRAINMAGHNSIKMKDLAEMFAKIGYSEAKIYIQSGNIIFRSGEDRNTLTRKIAEGIKKVFDLDIKVIIRTLEEVRNLEGRNPYLEEQDFDPSRMAVVFLDREPEEEALKKIAGMSFPPDKFQIGAGEIFLYCPNGFGRSKLTTVFFERKLNVFGTARNWKTVNSILDIAEKV